MGDRQRNFAQYATALNQYANFNNDGERSSRDRDGSTGGAAPGSSSSGSTSSTSSSGSSGSGSSHGGTSSAGNAAIWGELSRSLQYNNYPGFGSAWQGGGGDMRLYGYGGYGDGQVDGRGEARSENRGEGRRVPSKGETKATPPLPPGIAPGVGSALASLQQLVASGGEAAAVYRSLLAARQYAAAAAALGALPTPPPPSLNPAALHAATALSSHHQQQQQQQQQQRRQQHQQHHQQQMQQQQAAAFAAAAAGLNGEGLGMHGASRMQQASPQGRKCTPVPPEVRHEDPLPSPGRSRSHPPPIIGNQEVVCTPIMGKAMNEPPGIADNSEMGSDGRRVQSGSESEGDQRARHRRKQEQPRRQSVIYPVAMQSESGGGGDSSSDDSQGYDVLLTRNAVDHRDSPHDSVHSNSPVDPALRLSREAFPGQGMSQAMSHALAHPFLAAHLNASQLLQVAQTTPPPPPAKPDVPSAPSPHSQTHQLQVRTDLLEPHPKEVETYPKQEIPRPFSQPQINLPEIEIRTIRTPPSNASLDSSAAPVKKRRCSPSYLENDSSASDVVNKAPLSEAGRSDLGGNGVTSTNINQTQEESTAHTLSPNIESIPPVNGISATSDEAVDKNASSSVSSECQSSLSVNLPSSETEKVLNRNVNKNDQDFYNGDNEMLYSPRRRNRKRKSESEPVSEENPANEGQLEDSSVESKRRTRQKRAISYVEDGTDPVLEMNEDPSPDVTPMKKKGRKPKEVREKVDSENIASPEQSGSCETPLSSPPLPPPPPPLLQPMSPQDESSSAKSMHNSPPGNKRGRGLYRGVSRRGRISTHEFSNITEPLHVDTTLAQEPDLRVPGPPPITPSSCSPDVYDFNDTDSDGVGRGKKGKRGRKKGFSPKKNSKSPVDTAKSSVSPRGRDVAMKSPKSPKFFSSSRSPASERNKEWLRELSPPGRDLSKSLSDVPGAESSGAHNHNSMAGDGKQGEMLPNSESCDSPSADSNEKHDPVTSPRRSSRRVKPREMDSCVADFIKDDSSDLSLQSLPSNSKLNTSFSGSISNSLQNSDEKNGKADGSPLHGLDIPDGSPSSRVRRRGRRSADQNELLATPLQGNSEDDLSFDMDKDPSSSVKETMPTTKAKVKKFPDDPEMEKGGSLSTPEVQKSRRGRKPKSLAEKLAGEAEGAKGKGKFKKRKRKFTRLPKGSKKKGMVARETEVLPEETKQYQHVPENSYNDINNPAEKGPLFDLNSHNESESKTLACEDPLSSPPVVPNDIRKYEGSSSKGRLKKVSEVMKAESSSTGNGDQETEAVLNTSDKAESVIAQMEETESRSRRLRVRRGSAKQDKSEPECTKSVIPELVANEDIKSSKYSAQEMDGDMQQEDPGTLITADDNKDGVGKVKEFKPDGQSSTCEIQSAEICSQSSILSTTQEVKPGPQSKGPEMEDGFGGQFKALIDKDDTLQSESDIQRQEEPRTDRPQESQKSSQGEEALTGISKAASDVPDNANNEHAAFEVQKSELKATESEAKVETLPEEQTMVEPKTEGEKPPEPSTKADMEEPKDPPQRMISSDSEEKLAVQEPPQSSDNYPIPSGSVDPNKDSSHNIPADLLLDVPETVVGSLPLAPPDAMEVPQGTDMDVDAETVENIAKFLEETASSIPGATEENLSGKRPKRSSRPPRKMDDNEMNDLLMLLNMEDEESEDEDYVPKDFENTDSTAESEGMDSDGNDDDDSGDDYESEGRGGGSTLSNLFDMASDIAGDNDKVPTSMKHGKGGTAKPKGLKNGKGKKYKGESANSKKGKVKGKVKSGGKGRYDDDKKKSEDGKKKGEGGERKGPYVRIEPRKSAEVIVNTPYRDEDEQDRQVRKMNIHFYCKIEAKQKTAKVGYNSTLHNNYDAFSKDTSWFCSFCKNYSHTYKLGDLFGPYFIEGLTLQKKKYPKVIEGQVVESCSPSDVGRLKKRPPRRESASDVPGENRKLELGGSSPPWRFVPAATPARMLCRPGSKEGGGAQQTPETSNPVSTINTKEGSNGDPQNPVAPPAEDRPPGTECWVHESCLLWSPGVHVSNSRLCGLEEAVIHAQDSICNNCNEAGATVGCLGKGCSLMVHVPCATQLHWLLDHQTFRSFCPKHSTLT